MYWAPLCMAAIVHLARARPRLVTAFGTLVAAATLLRALPLPAASQDAPLRSVALAADPSTVLVADRSGRAAVIMPSSGVLLLLDTRTGALIRTVRVGTRPVASFNDDGTRLVVASGAGGGQLMAIDLGIGQALRTVPVADPLALAFDSGTRSILVASGATSRVGMLEPQGLRTSAAASVPCCPVALVADPAVARLLVLSRTAFGRDGYASVIDTARMRVVAASTVDLLSDALVLDRARHTVWLDGGSPTGNVVSAIDLPTGALLHTFQVGIGPDAIAVDRSNGDAVVTSAASQRVSLLAVRPPYATTTIALDRQPVQASAGAAHGKLFVLMQTAAGTAGSVVIVDARATRAVYRVDLQGEPIALRVLPKSGLAIALFRGTMDRSGAFTANGTLAILAVHTGRLVHTIAVAADPIGMALDERAGRLIVYSAAYRRRIPDPLPWMPAGVRRLLPVDPTGAAVAKVAARVDLFALDALR